MTSGRRTRAMRQGEAVGTGIKVEARHKFNATMTDPGPGQHFWTLVGMWRLSEPSAFANAQVMLDLENLVSIEGPGCFKCERPWSPELERKPCPGSLDLQ